MIKLCVGFSFGFGVERAIDRNFFLLLSIRMLSFGAVFSGYIIDKSFLKIYGFCPIDPFYKFLTLFCVFSGCVLPFFVFIYSSRLDWKKNSFSVQKFQVGNSVSLSDGNTKIC